MAAAEIEATTPFVLLTDEEDVIDLDLTQTSTGSISTGDLPNVRRQSVSVAAQFLEVEEQRVTPSVPLSAIRHRVTGLYTDGNYKAAAMKAHINPSSIPVLDTPSAGVLHVITGWKSQEVLSDLCYRFEPRGAWSSMGRGFLTTTTEMMQKRGYRCNGVMVCPVLLNSREHFHHSNAEEWISIHEKGRDERTRLEFAEMKKARNLYVTLTNPERQFCNAVLCPETSERNVGQKKCDGGPAIRKVHATGEWFVGCTHFFKYRNVKTRHCFHPLRHFTDTARGYLQEMIEKRKPIVIPVEICEFIAVKKGRGVKRCATNAVELLGSGTNGSKEGRCPAKMLLIEPIRQNVVAGRKCPQQCVTYAICAGSHHHPPPPQAESTDRKNAMFRAFAEQSPMTAASKLTLETQLVLKKGSSSPLQNLRLSKNTVYNTLAEVRKSRQQDEYTSIFQMVGNPNEPYVRDVEVVKDGFVFLLATGKMLRQGRESAVLAGDATFKTLKETDPNYETPDWKVYNIIAPYDPTMPKHTGVVVARALMTTLTNKHMLQSG